MDEERRKKGIQVSKFGLGDDRQMTQDGKQKEKKTEDVM